MRNAILVSLANLKILYLHCNQFQFTAGTYHTTVPFMVTVLIVATPTVGHPTPTTHLLTRTDVNCGSNCKPPPPVNAISKRPLMVRLRIEVKSIVGEPLPGGASGESVEKNVPATPTPLPPHAETLGDQYVSS